MPAHSYMEENGSAAILATKRSAGATPVLNLMEHVTYIHKWCTNKAAHSSFETFETHQKSKTGVSVAPIKGLMSSNFFFKNKLHLSFLLI